MHFVYFFFFALQRQILTGLEQLTGYQILTHSFRPSGPQEVIVTGSIDNWSKSYTLFKHGDGTFTLQVPLQVQKEPILYKYIVDGEWKVNPSEKTTKDFEGNENNVLDPEDLKELVTIPGALIPESGLAYPKEETKDKATDKDNTTSATDSYKTTVLPKEEPHQTSLTGEPGIHIPKDKDQLAVFDQYESTDAKALNEDVKEVGTANFNQGIQIPQDTSAFEKIEDTDPKALNEDVKEVGTAEGTESKDFAKKSEGEAAGPTGVKDDSEAAIAAATVAAAGAAGVGAGADAAESAQGDNLKKVKRVEYRGKKKDTGIDDSKDVTGTKDIGVSKDATGATSKDATAGALTGATVGGLAGAAAAPDATRGSTATDVGAVSVPTAVETGNETSNVEYLSNEPKVTPGAIKQEAQENDQINKEVRDEFEDVDVKDTAAPDTTRGSTATDVGAVSVPTAVETGNETSNVEYLNNKPKVTPGALKQEAQENDQINKEVRDEFEDVDAKDRAAPDHSTAKVLGAAALGGAGGAGLGSALADQPLDLHADPVHGPFSTSTEAKQSVSDPYASTAPVVVDDTHPKTLDPKAGQEEPAPSGTTAPSTLAAEPEIKPVTGSNLDEGREVNASPVAKDYSKSRVAAPTAPAVVDDEDEEEIIIARGNEDDILAAVEATEGHDVTLEEIKLSKAEEEKLREAAQLASEEGPVTIEQVVVPEEKVHRSSSTKSPTSHTSKTSPPTVKSASEVPVKTTKKQKEDDEKKKKKRGFRSLFSRK